MITISRYHDFSAAHRSVNDDSKCWRIHGHNYRVTWTFASHNGLDHKGRIIDFGEIKRVFCEWLEENWDHKILIWEEDPVYHEVIDKVNTLRKETPLLADLLFESIVEVPFDTSVENMAEYLRVKLGPALLQSDPDTVLVCVHVEETRKCSATSTSDTTMGDE